MTSKRKDLKMHRTKAERALIGIVERAKANNADPGRCYDITEFVVFGSYVSDKAMLSDLDVAVRFKARYPTDSIEFENKRNEYKGRNELMRYDWPNQSLMLYLRRRNPYISIHRLGRSREQDDIIYGGPHIKIDLESSYPLEGLVSE